MKKFLCVLVGVCLAMSLSACGTSSAVIQTNSDSVGVQDNSDSRNTIDKNPTFQIGDTIMTDNMNVTINDVALSYDVLPDDISGFYTHYQADDGKVYIAIDADVYNQSKRPLSCDAIGVAKADYNDGYQYKGFIIVKDSSTGFTYANISSIDPLETKGIKWLIECPEEIETSDKPLVVLLTIDGKTFEYAIR